MVHRLVNQFDLKPGVDRARFEAAWDAFAAYLLEEGLAATVGPLFDRAPDSSYDTDAGRGHGLMAVITFADGAQADRAWQAIEAGAQPLGRLHAHVFGLVHDPVFTFWRALD